MGMVEGEVMAMAEEEVIETTNRVFIVHLVLYRIQALVGQDIARKRD